MRGGFLSSVGLLDIFLWGFYIFSEKATAQFSGIITYVINPLPIFFFSKTSWRSKEVQLPAAPLSDSRPSEAKLLTGSALVTVACWPLFIWLLSELYWWMCTEAQLHQRDIGGTLGDKCVVFWCHFRNLNKVTGEKPGRPWREKRRWTAVLFRTWEGKILITVMVAIFQIINSTLLSLEVYLLWS